MVGFFSKILQAVAGSENLKSKHIETFYQTLKSYDRQLPAKIASYVVRGDSDGVISTLSTPKVRQAWDQRYNVGFYITVQTDLFAVDINWSTSEIARIGDVLVALNPVTQGQTYGLGGSNVSPDWLRSLLAIHIGSDSHLLELSFWLEMLKERGLGIDIAFDMIFGKSPNAYGGYDIMDSFKGVDVWLKDNAGAIPVLSQQLMPAQRAQLVARIGRFELTNLYLPLIVDSGIAPGKALKKAAIRAIVSANPQQLETLLDERFSTANPTARADLVELAIAGLGKNAPLLLEKWKTTEDQAKVLTAIDRGLGNLSLVAQVAAEPDGQLDYYVALDGTHVAIPPRQEMPRHAPVPDSVFALLDTSIKSFNALYEAGKIEAKGEQWHWTKHSTSIDFLTRQTMKRELENQLPSKHPKSAVAWRNLDMVKDKSGIEAFLASPELSLRHRVNLQRLGSYAGFLWSVSGGTQGFADKAIRDCVANGTDIRLIADLWKETHGTDALGDVFYNSYNSLLHNFNAELFWPLITDRFDILDEAFGLRSQSKNMRANIGTALDAVSLLPKVPQRYLLPLMNLASSGTKAQRQEARALLASAPGINANIAEQLKDGKQDIRAGAADWLAQRLAKDQTKALRDALKTERSDMCRAAMISALERVGDDVSDYFNPATMKKDAETGLAKTATKGLDWFPFDLLPTLHWLDGQLVDPTLVRWWIVLTTKLKQPGGNALLDLWLARLAPGDAHKVGLFVLTSWIDQDTRQTSPEEANAYALANVDTILKQNQQAVKRNPEYAEYYTVDRDKIFASLKNEKLNTYLGSATESKGILALTSRVDGADAARLVRGFLKNHGSRVAQCKAVLDALAANPSSAAIQIVLATSNRFKARTVQAHAQTLIDDIANRRGWTSEELADRTIPTGGLDETGCLELDCGMERSYKITLDETDTVTLLNPAGKKVSTLPTARVDEEKALLDEAKKLLTTARKEIKQVLPDQVIRLREAMLVQRKWNVGDWQLCVAGHPLVGRLAQRLVWMALDEDSKVTRLFRPLDDGTMTDVDDATFELSQTTSVQLAHSSLIDRATRDAWRAHLEAYEVKPPFDQLNRSLPMLDHDQKAQTQIKDRTGWTIETFKLRGAATKLNYQRGDAEDGGWFTVYERPHQSAGLTAVIEFSGSPLPEENMPATLLGLTFVKLNKNNRYHGEAIALGDVPPVLLTETWQDLRDIADKGAGYDANWEKNARW